MPEESNLQEVLDAVESLKKENNSIIEYIKSNDKTIKSNQKLLDLLSDKSDVYDRNSSLSDNIDELNKTLKGLPKSLKVEGEGKSFNFLDLLPVLGGVLALSYLKGSFDDSKGEGEGDKTSLEQDIDNFNQTISNISQTISNIFSEKGLRQHVIEPLEKSFFVKGVAKDAAKYIRNVDVTTGKVAAKKAEKATAKAAKAEEKAIETAIKAADKTSSNRVIKAADKEVDKAVNKAIKASKAAESATKAAEVMADKAAVSVGKRIAKTAAKSLLFVDKGARAWFLYEKLKEQDYVGAGLEGTGLLLSSARDLSLMLGVTGWVSVPLQGALFGVDSYTTYRDVKNAISPLTNNPNNTSQEKDTNKRNFNVGASGTSIHCINFFRNKGFTLKAACGIAGNAYIESTFKSKWDPPKKHFGVFQWDKERRERFSKVFHKHITESTLEEQYNYAIWELEHYIKRGITNGNYTINFKETPEEAAKWWADIFEVCQGQALQERMRMARKFYDDYQKVYNASKQNSKLSNTSSKVPNSTSNNLKDASKAEQQKLNRKYKNYKLDFNKPTSKSSQNTNQNLVTVSSPTYNSSNYFGEVTPDIQDQSWYNYQRRTGVIDAFPGTYST